MAAIDVSDLTKHYGEVRAVEGLSFAVEAGEVFGYLGPNGAGKTTTIRMLLGLVLPTSGGATVLDHDVRQEAELVAAKRAVGYLPSDPAFDEGATGREILDLHANVKGGERRAELLELFDPPLDRPVREYSSGNVQKLGIVQAFMHDPDLAILDEPTAGLDPLMQHRFNELLRAERDRGVTVFLSSHVLGEVRRVCDRVGIVRDGELVTIEPVEALLNRSGKVVRLRSAEPVPADALDLDGVHDLELATDDGEPSSGGGRKEDGAATDVPVEPADAGITEATFTFTGDVGSLVERLAEFELVDLSIEEAPLEDVFMRFYGGVDGDEAEAEDWDGDGDGDDYGSGDGYGGDDDA